MNEPKAYLRYDIWLAVQLIIVGICGGLAGSGFQDGDKASGIGFTVFALLFAGSTVHRMRWMIEKKEDQNGS